MYFKQKYIISLRVEVSIFVIEEIEDRNAVEVDNWEKLLL
jgi:hypothetical protein